MRALFPILIKSGLTAATFDPSAIAGDLSAELNRTRGTIDDRFELAVTIEGEISGIVRVPDVDGVVMKQEGRRQRFDITGQQSREEVRLTFGLYPKRVGKFTIPPIRMRLDGEEMATLPLKFHVVSSPVVRGTESDQQSQVYLAKKCQRRRVFVREPVRCVVTTYHLGQLVGGQAFPRPSTQFYRLGVEQESQSFHKAFRGRDHLASEQFEWMVPDRSGKGEIPPHFLIARVLVSGEGRGVSSPLDRLDLKGRKLRLGLPKEVRREVESNPVPVQVLPLPNKGKPKHFSGLVGDFELTAHSHPKFLKSGELLTITINISGHGILWPIEHIAHSFDKWGTIISEKPQLEETATKHGIQSRKTFRYLLKPTEQHGSIALDPVRIDYFDPKREKYVEKMASFHPIKIQVGDQALTAVDFNTAEIQAEIQSEIQAAAATPSSIFEQPLSFRPDIRRTLLSAWLARMGWGLAVIAGLILLVRLAIIPASVNLRRWLDGVRRRRKAWTLYQRILGHRVVDPEAGYRALQGYLRVRLGGAANLRGGWTAPRIIELLKGAGIRDDLMTTGVELLDDFEKWQYAAQRDPQAGVFLVRRLHSFMIKLNHQKFRELAL